MKRCITFGIFALLVWACSPVKDTSKTSGSLALSSQDSTEYDIIIIDPGFDQWYLLNYNEAKDHSNEYYRNQNLIAVSDWNDYYRRDKFSQVVDSHIFYEPQTDYGIEVNRKLYWYFEYVKEKYGIKLGW